MLGRHSLGEREVIRCFLPRTRQAWIEDESRPMQRLPGTDLFEYRAKRGEISGHYRVIRETEYGAKFTRYDPYAFWAQLGKDEMASFNYGRHHYTWNMLGARHHEVDGIVGTLFSVWAPNAGRVSVIGDFNDWDGRRHTMRLHPANGLWEIFIPGVGDGEKYKFELLDRNGRLLPLKNDPYGHYNEPPPGNASIVFASQHQWSDYQWMQHRMAGPELDQPISIYELHPGSWARVPACRPCAPLPVHCDERAAGRSACSASPGCVPSRPMRSRLESSRWGSTSTSATSFSRS